MQYNELNRFYANHYIKKYEQMFLNTSEPFDSSFIFFLNEIKYKVTFVTSNLF